MDKTNFKHWSGPIARKAAVCAFQVPPAESCCGKHRLKNVRHYEPFRNITRCSYRCAERQFGNALTTGLDQFKNNLIFSAIIAANGDTVCESAPSLEAREQLLIHLHVGNFGDALLKKSVATI